MTTNKRNMTSEEMKAQVIEKIKEYTEKDFKEASRIHELIMEANPNLYPRLWYGMPGYALSKDSAVLVYFRRDGYITFGLSEYVDFKLEKSASDKLMPCAWFFTELDEQTEERIKQIVHQATAK